MIDAILIRNPSDSEFYYHHIWVSAREEVEALLNWFSLLEKVGSRQALSTLSLSPFTLDSPFPSLVRASCQPLVRQLLMGTCTALQDKHIACNKHPQYLLGFLSVGLRRRLSGLLEYWAGSLALFYDYARTPSPPELAFTVRTHSYIIHTYIPTAGFHFPLNQVPSVHHQQHLKSSAY